MGTDDLGRVRGVNGSLVEAEFPRTARQNEMAYVVSAGRRLKSEVIRVMNNRAVLQVYEETRGIRLGEPVEFTGRLLSATLGPGLLGRIFDGLQNPLLRVAEKHGFFLPVGVELPPLDPSSSWEFTPLVKEGDLVFPGGAVGKVPEGLFEHLVMVPPNLPGPVKVLSVAGPGALSLADEAARVADAAGSEHPVGLSLAWPIRVPFKAGERILPQEPLITGIRIVDTLFPVSLGGTFCTPGPFGAGKTVLQQITARHARVDVVIIAACGERAGEVVETLTEFPKLTDPRTGRGLMERTIIVCNTSSMPVASRESSVYTAVTMAEYYRQMGLDVLLLADSTSRWAQAMREISGRLEEIPGEEAYPAYLESRIASFYERAGVLRLPDGRTGSVTIGGTVSPAGGTFEEPVTQGTIKVVGAFHGLSRDRANARRYPSIDPHESWSTYPGIIGPEKRALAREILARGRETARMMKVVGEEGTSMEDYVEVLKAEFLDNAFLQQDAFDLVDAATARERQEYVFDFALRILAADLAFPDKNQALAFFQSLTGAFTNWNFREMDSDGFKDGEKELERMLAEISAGKDAEPAPETSPPDPGEDGSPP